MPKNLTQRTKLVHYVCAALLLVLLVMQFTPFWHYGEAGETVSISGYIWFPSDHNDLTSYLQQMVGSDFTIDTILVPCILMLLLSAAGAVLCVIKPGEWLASLLAVACGLSGVIGFLTCPALRLGSAWAMQLLLCILLLCGGGYAFYLAVASAKA